jgi:hypothetical protein
MGRKHRPAAERSRSTICGISLWESVAMLITGISCGQLLAQAPTDTGARRVERRASQRQSVRPDTGFDFYDLRVQASEDSAPALRQVRSGQEVRVGVYVRYWKPARIKRASSGAGSRTGASPSGNPFAATRARYVCRYALLFKGLELRRDMLPVDLTLAKGSAVTTFRAFTITLPEGVRENSYLVRAAVTMNGATQTRTTRFTVYR